MKSIAVKIQKTVPPKFSEFHLPSDINIISNIYGRHFGLPAIGFIKETHVRDSFKIAIRGYEL